MYGRVPFSQVASLASDEYEAYADAVEERTRQEVWNAEHELLAYLVEITSALLIEVKRGVGVVQLEKQQKPEGEPYRPPRPDWMDDYTPPDQIETIHPSQLGTLLGGR